MPNRMPLLASLLLLVPLAASAQETIDKANYSLTFSSHWSTDFMTAPDSNTAAIMDMEHEAVAWVNGVPAMAGMTADQYMQILTAAYQTELTRTDSSEKKLGGRTFKTTGWKDLDTADADDQSRLRIYATSEGGLYFIAWIVYESPTGDPAVAEFEAALATLQTKTTGIRAAWLRGAGLATAGAARLDLLGRSRSPSAPRSAPGFYLTRR